MNKFMMRLAAAVMAVAMVGVSMPVMAKGGFSGGRSVSFSRPSPSFFKAPSAPVRVAPPPAPPAPVKQVQVAPPPKPAAPPPQAPAPQPPAPQAPQKSLFVKNDAPAGYDKKAFEAQKHADSKAAFDAAKGRTSVPVQTAQAGQSQGVTQTSMIGSKVVDISAVRAAREKRVAELSARMAKSEYRQRDVRAQNVYGSYYSNPVPTPSYYGGGYNDSFSNPAFWWWLGQQERTERERFIYNHRSEIDPRRLNDMQAAYPELSAQLNQLESSGVKPDTRYVPTNLKGNEDLIYGDDVASDAKKKASSTSSLAWFYILLMVLMIGGSIYYVLFSTWKVKVKNA